MKNDPIHRCRTQMAGVLCCLLIIDTCAAYAAPIYYSTKIITAVTPIKKKPYIQYLPRSRRSQRILRDTSSSDPLDHPDYDDEEHNETAVLLNVTSSEVEHGKPRDRRSVRSTLRSAFGKLKVLKPKKVRPSWMTSSSTDDESEMPTHNNTNTSAIIDTSVNAIFDDLDELEHELSDKVAFDSSAITTRTLLGGGVSQAETEWMQYFSFGPYRIPMLNTSSIPIVATAMSSVSGIMYELNDSLQGYSNLNVPKLPMVPMDELESILKSTSALDDSTIAQIMQQVNQSTVSDTPAQNPNRLMERKRKRSNPALEDKLRHNRPYSLGLTSYYDHADKVAKNSGYVSSYGTKKRWTKSLPFSRRKRKAPAQQSDENNTTISESNNTIPQLLEKPDAGQVDKDEFSISGILDSIIEPNATKKTTTTSTDPSKIYFASTGYDLPYFDASTLTVNASSLLESLYYKPIKRTTPPLAPPSAFASYSKGAVSTQDARPFATSSKIATRSDKNASRVLAPTDTLTLADLEFILEQRGYGKSDSNEHGGGKNKVPLLPASSSASDGTKNLSGRRSKAVAFPQPSVLDYKGLQKGTTAAGVFYGGILGATLLPNLWLVGSVGAGMYGHEITNRLGEVDDKSEDGESITPPSHVLARLLIGSGRRLTRFFLKAYDACSTMWFLYKTGQLSYQYYKTYEDLDGKFKIQDKIDAWNARFQAGKVKFDLWEEENEVGRKVLATLRTAWIVEEQSMRKGRKSKPRYRLLQSMADTLTWCRRTLGGLYRSIKTGDSRVLKDFLRGIRAELTTQEWNTWITRIGAIVASLVIVNLVGAVYAISAPFVAVSAIIVAIIWPTWVAEFFERLRQFGGDISARGRGESTPTRSRKRRSSSKHTTKKQPAPLLMNLKVPIKPAPTKKRSGKHLEKWPWKRDPVKKRRTPQKEQWGIFGQGLRKSEE